MNVYGNDVTGTLKTCEHDQQRRLVLAASAGELLLFFFVLFRTVRILFLLPILKLGAELVSRVFLLDLAGPGLRSASRDNEGATLCLRTLISFRVKN